MAILVKLNVNSYPKVHSHERERQFIFEKSAWINNFKTNVKKNSENY